MNNKYLKSADCNNCFLRKGEYCTQLSNNPCLDFKPIPIICREERDSWPLGTEIWNKGMVNSFGYKN